MHDDECEKWGMGICCCDCELNVSLYSPHQCDRSTVVGHVCIKDVAQGSVKLIDLTIQSGTGHGFCQEKRFGVHKKRFNESLKKFA